MLGTFYADAIEPLMGNLISKITAQANLLVQNGTIIIHDFEKAQLAYIMIMQLLRGKQSHEYERCLYQKCLPSVQESVKAVFASLGNEQNELLQGFINDDYYFKRTAMDVTLHEEKIKKFSTAIYNHDFIFYRIQGNAESRFIRTINRKQIEQCSQHAFAQSEGVLKQYITKK